MRDDYRRYLWVGRSHSSSPRRQAEADDSPAWDSDVEVRSGGWSTTELQDTQNLPRHRYWTDRMFNEIWVAYTNTELLIKHICSCTGKHTRPAVAVSSTNKNNKTNKSFHKRTHVFQWHHNIDNKRKHLLGVDWVELFVNLGLISL